MGKLLQFPVSPEIRQRLAPQTLAEFAGNDNVERTLQVMLGGKAFWLSTKSAYGFAEPGDVVAQWATSVLPGKFILVRFAGMRVLAEATRQNWYTGEAESITVPREAVAVFATNQTEPPPYEIDARMIETGAISRYPELGIDTSWDGIRLYDVDDPPQIPPEVPHSVQGRAKLRLIRGGLGSEEEQ